ncbi:sensor histidine kinase [Ktedonospora formicarum]|uniref:histidine kinase n=1 Tax=Ktedonospora formicarum TaxID=2778364 RepID=A0A8J3I3H6_9CHLR|nr:ATP-binding protein [Ktedonospora formicarum]GHO46073.1 two-component sensor histidine kinase [Ktedonospora formicarum]
MQATAFSFGQTIRPLRFFHSLRFRLMLWYLLIWGLVLCTFSAAIYFSEESTLYQSLETVLKTNIEHVTPFYDPMLGRLSETNVNALVILQNPQGQITQVNPTVPPEALPELRLRLSQAKGWGQGPLWRNSQSFTTSTVPNGQELRFASAGSPVFTEMGAGQGPYSMQQIAMRRITITNQQNQLLAYLYIGVPSDIPEQLQQLLITLVVTTSLILLCSSVGGYWLAERAMRPVQTITRTAQEISTTDLHRRLNLRQRDELGELATTFDRMLDRLERAFERQRQFTADASHELRTPLSIVTTEVERILQRPRATQDYIQVLSIIHQEHQRMTRLVSDLLTLARADQGQTVLKRERVDLSEIVVEAAEDLSPLAEQSAIEIHLSGLDELGVWGDRLYLTQLCINLLENAIKYSAGIGKQVKVKLDREPRHARLQIVDEGPGIDAEHLPHLFERFYRVDQSRTHVRIMENMSSPSGSGLGLSIARWIVEEHGGTIQVRSTPGVGSVFEICFPLLTDI